MEHSAKFNKVKQWYDLKMWSEGRVHNAVVKGWITEAEFQEITGKVYSVDVPVTGK